MTATQRIRSAVPDPTAGYAPGEQRHVGLIYAAREIARAESAVLA